MSTQNLVHPTDRKNQILIPLAVVLVMRNPSGPDRNTSQFAQSECGSNHPCFINDSRFFRQLPKQRGMDHHRQHPQNNFPDHTTRSGWSLWTILKVYSRTRAAGHLMFDDETWRSLGRSRLEPDFEGIPTRGTCTAVRS